MWKTKSTETFFLHVIVWNGCFGARVCENEQNRNEHSREREGERGHTEKWEKRDNCNFMTISGHYFVYIFFAVGKRFFWPSFTYALYRCVREEMLLMPAIIMRIYLSINTKLCTFPFPFHSRRCFRALVRPCTRSAHTYLCFLYWH